MVTWGGTLPRVLQIRYTEVAYESIEKNIVCHIGIFHDHWQRRFSSGYGSS